MDFLVVFLLALAGLLTLVVGLFWLSGVLVLNLKQDHKEYLEFDLDD